MRTSSLFLVIAIWIWTGIPTHAALAQTEMRLSTVKVQLRPEYDQPSMLVIYDFEVPADTELPASLTFRIPEAANLTAVASLQGSVLVDAPADGPVVQGSWQVFTVNVTSRTQYHFEYYQPLDIKESTRRFTFIWDGSYAVDAFSVELLQPLDTLSLTTEPMLNPVSDVQGLSAYASEPTSLGRGQQYVLRLEYEKTSDALVVPPEDIQPAAPVDQSTAGRVSITQYLPYALGAAGIALGLGALLYYSLSGRRSGQPRRRRRFRPEREQAPTGIYCPQCGARAKTGDHFCRQCGTRLRKKE